jgi:hypothetical protein
LLLVQGVVGFFVAFGGVAVNMGIVSQDRPRSAKVWPMTGTLVVVVAIDVVIAVAASSVLGT